jgi:hypothetical protein
MAQPAPARFDADDRLALRAGFFSALGPLLTLGALITGYALSARVCGAGAFPALVATIVVAGLGCAVAAWGLWVFPAANGGKMKSLRLASCGLQLFCLCVMIGYAFVLGTDPHCG